MDASYKSMSAANISDRVKNFIFLYVDSVELLEILLLFYQDDKKSWSAQAVAMELRSNAGSVEKRILLLKSFGLVSESPHTTAEYFYNPGTNELHEIVTELATVYRVRKHSVLGLIFSPMKKAKDFAEAFRLGGKKQDGNEDG